MSKIAKALQKAKQERGEMARPIESNASASLLAQSGTTQPVYTQTRVVSFESEVLEPNRVIAHLEDPKVRDSYNLLRTQILQKTRGTGMNTIMITSAKRHEGKTVTAINLALSMSLDVQQTALLVDMNLRHPQIHHYLGLAVEAGVSDHLEYGRPIEELLVNPGLEKLVVFPVGKPMKGSPEILGSPRVQAMVLELKTRYRDRFVIFDCPQVLNAPEVIEFSAFVDGIVFVVEADQTPIADVQKALGMLSGRNIFGLVMNKLQDVSLPSFIQGSTTE